jgi:hypothetical protein
MNEPQRWFSRSSLRVQDAQGNRWPVKDEEYADFAGLGLTKISLAFQKARVPAWEQGHWSNLDTRFSLWTYGMGYKFHVHRPKAKHFHFDVDGGRKGYLW